MTLTAPPCVSSADPLEAKAQAWQAEQDLPAWAFYLAALLPTHCTARFAAHHRDFWDWLWAIQPGMRPDAFLGVWPRGGAKSTSAEAGVVVLGARKRRRYGLYVSGTQDQADDHVSTIGDMLESDRVALWYPELASRKVGKHGNPRGWRRNRLWTADGLIVDACGLETGIRGVKLEDQRPDFIVIDDVDHTDDSTKVTQGKLDTLTRAVLPAGADDVAVLAIQNLVQPNGVFARLVDGRADFLKRRHLSGPIPALTKFSVDVDGQLHGEPTWDGQPLELCQSQAEDWGIRSFRVEAQHEVQRREGAMWSPEQIDETRALPAEIETAVVGVDPSGGDGPDNDEQGIVVVGKDAQGHGYVLADLSCKTQPEKWGKRALLAALEHGADVAVESNFGADMAIAVLRNAAHELDLGIVVKDPHGKVLSSTFGPDGIVVVWRLTAHTGKTVRAEPVAALYGDPEDADTWPTARMHHADTFAELEDEMTSFVAGLSESPNRLDAMVWAASKLFGIDVGKRGGLRSHAEPNDGLVTEAAKRALRPDSTPRSGRGMRVRY